MICSEVYVKKAGQKVQERVLCAMLLESSSLIFSLGKFDQSLHHFPHYFETVLKLFRIKSKLSANVILLTCLDLVCTDLKSSPSHMGTYVHTYGRVN